MNTCCQLWIKTMESLKVTPKEFYGRADKLMAESIEKFMKWSMGSYCPCCGTKLVKDEVSK